MQIIPLAGMDKFWQLDVPGIDMYEEKGKLAIEVGLPEFSEKDINVTAADGAIEIKAEHESQSEDQAKDRKYLVRQRTTSSYWRKIALPEGAKYDEATADFKDGTLKITMPTAALPRPKAIPISSQASK